MSQWFLCQTEERAGSPNAVLRGAVAKGGGTLYAAALVSGATPVLIGLLIGAWHYESTHTLDTHADWGQTHFHIFNKR